ncbi:bacteriocin biosynthesis cyclodehydratase domain-containing protein [Pseudonocardia hierapolitana]|uniref:Bacteriocin biosynthesis cyclodehydratase domain-containing protein n=2 Tax=Pseudonocardia hierapolitana TaxID=1128676 RepID=A0A561SN10_9PSEU|nr:bacteriocin biosynthesis cyclodehydratase domain-containing protein [Pseudonocardia hierapolitana]
MLGLDPAAAMAVEDLPPPLAEMLDELTGAVPTAQLVDRAAGRGADRGEAELLLAELVASGVVVDAADVQRQERRRAVSTVVVHGCGPLAVGVVLGLATAGVGTVHVVASGTVLEADLGTGLVDADRGRDRGSATAAALARLHPQASTGPPRQRTVPDLVVLADAGTPDPVHVAGLHATGTSHLVVRVRDGVGVVGPLVLPGRTTCLGCMEIERCAREPAWTAAAAQLVGVPGRAAPACVAATAGLATAQALVALDGPDSASGPPVLDATLELDVDAGTIVRRTWAPHPDCRCGA